MNKFTEQKQTHRLRKTNSELPKEKKGLGRGEGRDKDNENVGNKPHMLLNIQIDRNKAY